MEKLKFRKCTETKDSKVYWKAKHPKGEKRVGWHYRIWQDKAGQFVTCLFTHWEGNAPLVNTLFVPADTLAEAKAIANGDIDRDLPIWTPHWDKKGKRK